MKAKGKAIAIFRDGLLVHFCSSCGAQLDHLQQGSGLTEVREYGYFQRTIVGTCKACGRGATYNG